MPPIVRRRCTGGESAALSEAVVLKLKASRRSGTTHLVMKPLGSH
jgi:hypothetical protein